MAFHNVNHTIIPFSAGFNGPEICGNGITASTIHEVFCESSGTVTITAFGGGSLTVALTAGQSVKVLCSSVNVASGSFVGFRAAHINTHQKLYG